jgi:diadenosine tetraphosphate (Ap4A) HIT family hydrolase
MDELSGWRRGTSVAVGEFRSTFLAYVPGACLWCKLDAFLRTSKPLGSWVSAKAMEQSSCIFCDNQEPVLAANEYAIAITDKRPIVAGHSLIISRKHVPTVFDLPTPDYGACFELVRTVKRLISEKGNVESFNIVVNCGWDAGQKIGHAHIHLVPRYSNMALPPAVPWRAVT